MDAPLIPAGPRRNLLPREGEAYYHGPVMSPADAGRHFETLRDGIAWRHDEVVMFGRRLVTARMVAWHGDAGLDYTYTGATKTALPWTPELLELKDLCERLSGARYNACLLNLYRDGGEGMGWHSDDEKALARHAAIASLSFGAERRFSFRHNATRDTVSLTLEHGSLLIMQGGTQTHWKHRLPPAKKITAPRVNLTFRLMERR